MAQRSALFVGLFVTIFVLLMGIGSLWLGSSMCQVTNKTIFEDWFIYLVSITTYGLFNICNFPIAVVYVVSALNTILSLYISMSFIFFTRGTS